MIARNAWRLNVNGSCAENTTGSVVEVRGSGRARRMARRRSLATSGGTPWGAGVDGTSTWTDYDGDTVYGDYVANFDEFNNFTGVTNTMAYLPGIGEAAVSPGLVSPVYYHGDQIGSLRIATDGTGNVVGRYVYSAFGEPTYEAGGTPSTSAVQTRYKFGGAWQYETGLGRDENGNVPLPFLRIGYRWYDPSTGRFLQRDPIGIEGGMNTYAYCDNDPVEDADPLGLDKILVREDKIFFPHEATIIQFFRGWLRIDYGSYGRRGPGDNIKLTWDKSPYTPRMMRKKDWIRHIRKTSRWTDFKTFLKALEKKNTPYRAWGPNCQDVAQELFNYGPGRYIF